MPITVTFSPAPSRKEPGTFSDRGDMVLSQAQTFINEANALEANVNAKEAATAADVVTTNADVVLTHADVVLTHADVLTAAATASFKGTWATLTGAANVPYAVWHMNRYWQLASNLADVTTKTPGTDPEWLLIPQPSIIRSTRTSDTTLIFTDIGTLIDVTSGTFTQTFTDAAILGDGWFCFYRVSGTGLVTLDPNSSELIDGVTTLKIAPKETRLIQCTGSAFNTILIDPGLTTSTATGDTTLSTSPTYLVITPSAFGKKITLPDATTCRKGLEYLIANIGQHSVGVCDSGGTLREVIGKGGKCQINLADNSSAVGVWVCINDRPEATLVKAKAVRSNTYTNSSPASNSIFVGTDYMLTLCYVNNSLYVQAYSMTDFTLGTAVLVSTVAQTTPGKLVALTSTTALVAWQGTISDTPNYGQHLVVATLSSTNTVTLGTPVSWDMGATSNATQPDLLALSSTQCALFTINESSGSYYYKTWGINISGTTITYSATALTIKSGGAGVSGSHRSNTAVDGTHILNISWDASTSTHVNYITYSGASTPTAGSTSTANTSNVVPAYLSSNKWIWSYGTGNICTITVSGSTPTINSAYNTTATNIDLLELYSSTLIFWHGSAEYGVVQEASNVITSKIAKTSYQNVWAYCHGSMSAAGLLYFSHNTQGMIVLQYDGDATINFVTSYPLDASGGALSVTVGTTKFFGGWAFRNNSFIPIRTEGFYAGSPYLTSGGYLIDFTATPLYSTSVYGFTICATEVVQ